MTDVSFHFNVADRAQYICRLARKASRQGVSVVLGGPPAALAHFDRALWTFDETEFLPHAVWRADAQAPGVSVWLAQDPAQCPYREVLVNLGREPPAGFERYARLLEVVSCDADDRAAARARWKHYAGLGHSIERHEAGA
jgi:DNA polymerase-3 subunit chi